MTDVVFGETSDTGFSASFFSAGEAWASKFTLSGGDPSAVLSKITAYMSDRSGSLQDLCVWRDVSGSPDALVGYGTPASPGPAGFYDATTLTLVDMAGVMPDGDYWIGFQDTASGLTQNIWTTGSGTGYFKGSAGPPPPDPFTGGSTTGLHFCVNATVTFTSCNPPVNAGGSDSPVASGTAEVGETLSVTNGTWTGDATITFTYQWYRFCGSGPEELITGETSSTYDVTIDDVGCDVFCRVTGDNDCNPNGTADSNDLGPVPEPPAVPSNVTAPVVSGACIVGHSLVSSHGTWTGSPSSYAYQWYIDCGAGFIAIGGATSSTYGPLTSLQDGCSIRVGVVATNGDGDSTEAFSTSCVVSANVPAAVRFCESPAWRFIVCDLDGETLTFLDRLATSRSVVLTLNAPAVATGIVPSDAPEVNIAHTDGDPFVAPGNRLLWGFRRELINAGSGDVRYEWIPRFAGIIQLMEDIADSDNANTHYTAYDPLKYLFQRPVQTIEGNPVGPNGLSFTATRVDVIIGTLVLNTIVNNGTTRIDLGAFYGGTGFWQGTIETLPQIDINFAQGTSVGDAIKQLTDANYCDILMTPVFDQRNRPGTLVDMSIVAQLGSVQQDAIFAWDKPSRSLVGISRLLELSAMANKVKYFAGAGGSATGGQNVPLQTDTASVTKYGQYWSQQFWPGERVVAGVQALAEAALELQKNGKNTVTISPVPGCNPLPFQEFFLGDRVPVYASNRFRQEIPTGTIQYQRIYGMPIDIADDSTEMIQQMLTSELGSS